MKKYMLIESNGSRIVTEAEEFERTVGVDENGLPLLKMCMPEDAVGFAPAERLEFYTWDDNRNIIIDENRKRRFAGIEGIAENRNWFDWYDNQVAQAARAQRLGVEWYASDGNRTYQNLAELDAEAHTRHNELAILLKELRQ